MNNKRKIFEKQIVDMETGEVISEETHYTTNNDETFGMHRTTEGVSWIFAFTGNEIQMLIVLLELEDNKTGIVSLSQLKKEELARVFSKTDRYIREIISSLEKKDGLIKLTSSDIMLNPTFFYKGGTKIFKEKYSKYKGLCNDRVTPIAPQTLVTPVL